MQYKKWAVPLLCCACAALLAACGAQPAQQSQTGEEAQASQSDSSAQAGATGEADRQHERRGNPDGDQPGALPDGAIAGRIVSVENGTVTISVGGGGRGGAQRPDAPEGQSRPDNKDEKPEMPPADGAAPAAPPAGSEASSADGAAPPENRTQSFPLADGAVITVNNKDSSTEGSVSDLTQGAFVTVTLDESGTATAITVRPGGGRSEEPANSAAPADQAADSSRAA